MRAHDDERAAWVWRIVAVLSGLAGIFWFSRGFFTSGFQLFQGDPGDARFTALVTSHWADPFQFAGGWDDLGFFYPEPHTLGFSDTMLAFGILAAPFASLGIPIAAQISLILAQAIGYTSMLAFLRLGPRSPWPIAIAGAMVWNFSNALFVSSGHPQLLAFSLVPFVLLCVLWAVRASSWRVRVAASFGAGASFALTLTTAFYVGWFTLLGAGLTIVIWIVLLVARRRARVSLRPLLLGIAAGLIGAAAVAPIFIATYAPVFNPTTERPIEAVLDYLIGRRELINLGPSNLVWSGVVERLAGDGLRIGEFFMAPTIGLLVVAASTLVVAVVRLTRLESWALLGLACLVSGFLLWLAPVEFGSVQPWRLVYEIPGASAIRAVGRVEILSGELLALGTALVSTQWWKGARTSHRGHIAAVLVAILLVFEQVNLGSPQVNTVEKAATLDSVSRPPYPCSSFVLVPPFDSATPPYEMQIDAMWVARVTGIPTWNGYSGLTPPNWRLDAKDPNYMRLARGWATIHRIRGACGFNLLNRTWLSPAELTMLIDRSVGWGKA